MIRFARVLSISAIALVAAAAGVQAQTSAGGAADAPKFFVGVDAGPTFGHHSSGFVGGEGGMMITPAISVVLEGGRMNNVGTEDLDTKASNIATNVRAT